MTVRVYQIAKEYSRSPDEILKILQESGSDVSSKTATLDEHELHTVRARLGKFKLTVVDGDQESQVQETEPKKEEPEAKDTGKKAKKPVKAKKKAEPEPPKPRLSVRVIKKHEDELAESEGEAEQSEPQTAAEPPPVNKAPRPRLRRPKERRSLIEERIHKIAEKRQHGEPGAAAQTAADPQSAPAGAAARPRADQASGPASKPKRPERPFVAQGANAFQKLGEAVGVRPQPDRHSRGGRPGGPGGRPGGPGGRPGGPGGRPGGPGGRPGGPGGRPGGPGGRPGGRPGGPGGRPGGPGGRGGRPGGPGGRPGGRPGGPGGRPGGPGGRPGGMGDLVKGGRPRFGGKPAHGKKNKRRRRRDVEHIEKILVNPINKVELPEEDLGIIMLSEGATIKELAEKVNRKAKDIIKRLFEKGIMATLNDVLESELAIEIAKDFGYLAEIVSFEEDLQIQEEETVEGAEVEETPAAKVERPPIVTIMGHVDHGKTTLLDAIRATKVASGEAGGITQHIGAYSVPCKGKDIVFLDTPGHEAFTKMRARGASVTDIVVLVVAADDGVKPQTVEAISHAKDAKVPIITCINKIDKPEANPERVKQMLTEHDLIVEDFGGDSPCVQVSAKTQTGINDLLEMILLVAELQDSIKATPTRNARGTVIEAQLDRGRGPVATLIVQDGTLKAGDFFITGQTYGKVRAMHDDMGATVELASPSTPVEILGLQEVPSAGDSFQVVEDEATARKISSFRKDRAREDQLRRQHTSLDQLFKNLTQSEVKELPIIIKADVHGSVEGLVFALNNIKSDKVNLRIAHQGVGNITENDVLLATAADAIIIGFNVKQEGKAESLAIHEGIDVRVYSVIYDVVKEIQNAMLGLVAPTLEEREIGRAVVKQIFSVAKLGQVAGCMVENGVIKRNAMVRVMRGEQEIFTGKVQTLKRFRDDVNEVKTGYECGIGIHDFSDYEENDALVFFVHDEVQATEL